MHRRNMGNSRKAETEDAVRIEGYSHIGVFLNLTREF